jgi:hypothetical protein
VLTILFKALFSEPILIVFRKVAVSGRGEGFLEDFF